MKYYNIIKESIKYGVGGLEPDPIIAQTYLYDSKFMFQFPLANRRNLEIYVIDNKFDLYLDSFNAAMKVYSNGEWIEHGGWIDEIENYLHELQSLLEKKKELIEAEKMLEEYEKARAEEDRRSKFIEMYGGIVEEFIRESHTIPADKTYDENVIFEDEDTIKEFMWTMFDAITEVREQK